MPFCRICCIWVIIHLCPIQLIPAVSNPSGCGNNGSAFIFLGLETGCRLSRGGGFPSDGHYQCRFFSVCLRRPLSSHHMSGSRVTSHSSTNAPTVREEEMDISCSYWHFEGPGEQLYKSAISALDVHPPPACQRNCLILLDNTMKTNWIYESCGCVR